MIDRYQMGFVTALRSVGYSDEYANDLYHKMKTVNDDAPVQQTTNASTPLVCVQCKKPIKDNERVVHQSCFNPIPI